MNKDNFDERLRTCPLSMIGRDGGTQPSACQKEECMAYNFGFCILVEACFSYISEHGLRIINSKEKNKEDKNDIS